MRATLDRCDGTAETILVLNMEEQLAGADPAWLASEHSRLQAMQRSDRGIRRQNWLKLKAVQYLIRAEELAAVTASRVQSNRLIARMDRPVSDWMQLCFWPSDQCVTKTSRRRFTKETQACQPSSGPRMVQLWLWPSLLVGRSMGTWSN